MPAAVSLHAPLIISAVTEMVQFGEGLTLEMRSLTDPGSFDISRKVLQAKLDVMLGSARNAPSLFKARIGVGHSY